MKKRIIFSMLVPVLVAIALFGCAARGVGTLYVSVTADSTAVESITIRFSDEYGDFHIEKTIRPGEKLSFKVPSEGIYSVEITDFRTKASEDILSSVIIGKSKHYFSKDYPTIQEAFLEISSTPIEYLLFDSGSKDRVYQQGLTKREICSCAVFQ